jgi:flagellar biosynthetic protein FliO
MDMSSVVRLVKVVGLAAWAFSASAAEVITAQEWAAQGGTTTRPPLSEVAGASILGIVVSLLVVLVLVVALAWVVKRLGMRGLMPNRGSHLEVLDRLPLAFKRQAVLLKVGNQAVLVGLGEHEVVHLATVALASVEEPVTAPREAGPPPTQDAASGAAVGASPFAKLLAARLPRRRTEAP